MSEIAGAETARSPSFADLVRVFARIGVLSFGGPAGQIALMHRELVEERKWLDEPRFLHALNYCMLLPGPEAMQLATYAGWLLHGVKGGLAAGLLFLLPGAAVLMLLSTVYLVFGHVDLVQGLLFGLKAAVLAVVIEALIKVSRRALKGGQMVMIAIVSFIGIALLKLPFPVIIVAAALAGVALNAMNGNSQPSLNPDPAPVPDWAQPSLSRLASTLALWLALWFGPLLLLHWTLGSGNVFAREASFFSAMAAVTFGGAYAVLSWVAQQAVEVHAWLRPDEMLTGLGLAETTPGPLILVLLFVGFLGGARQSGLDPLLGGIAGGMTALWFTFVPSFLWIFVGAPYVEKVRGIAWLATALAAVSAAVVGIIANLSLWFALHVLFGTVGQAALGRFELPVPDLASFEPAAAAIALGAGIALLWLHVNMIAVLGLAMMAGICVTLL